jgi:hypothetical protein
MTLTQSQTAMVVTDITIPTIATLGVCVLRGTRRITRSLFLTYWFGALIGAFWEIPFGLAGDSFLTEKFSNPLGFGVHITHCFWDSIIFLVGLWMVHIRNHNKWPGLKQLLGLVVWGLLQEFIVELIFNDRYWYYPTDNRYNQVVFTINGVGYTTWPFLTWIVSPILYLSGVMSIIDTYGPLVGGDVLTIDIDDRDTNLLDDDVHTSDNITLTISDTSTII